jgi:hypothetical protein
VVYGNFNCNFSPLHRKELICMLFSAEGNVAIVEWSAYVPIAHVVVRSCRKFEKEWVIASQMHINGKTQGPKRSSVFRNYSITW